MSEKIFNKSEFDNKFCVNFNSRNSNIFKKIKKKLKSHSFCVVKRVVRSGDIKFLYSLFKKRFKSQKEIRKSGPWIFKMKDFKRLDLETHIKIQDFQGVLLFVNGIKIIKVLQGSEPNN